MTDNHYYNGEQQDADGHRQDESLVRQLQALRPKAVEFDFQRLEAAAHTGAVPPSPTAPTVSPLGVPLSAPIRSMSIFTAAAASLLVGVVLGVVLGGTIVAGAMQGQLSHLKTELTALRDQQRRAAGTASVGTRGAPSPSSQDRAAETDPNSPRPTEPTGPSPGRGELQSVQSQLAAHRQRHWMHAFSRFSEREPGPIVLSPFRVGILVHGNDRGLGPDRQAASDRGDGPDQPARSTSRETIESLSPSPPSTLRSLRQQFLRS